ncbi:class I fructose-bisphosphate aldolase [Desulfovibrio inopinatus]|uniref:class I fructose-bisphosphate aldolase n=1 Tax=Desulfovibrio inopinatus TaxID=102109 RepID=UPI0004186D82|nr:fructose-bisphosphate aldolase [Desulfovibrio inopinatus]
MTPLERKTRRLFHPESNRIVMLPLDHGISDGMVEGLDDVPTLLNLVSTNSVQAVVLNKGTARRRIADVPMSTHLGIQLSGSTKHGLPPYAKTLVCTIHEAARLGADFVSLHINIGNDFEDRMLTDLGQVTDDAHLLGIPVLAVIQPEGGQIVDKLDRILIGHCIRLGSELGADIIGVPYSGDSKTFSAAVSTSNSPVVLTGGPSRPLFDDFCELITEAMDCGASGVCIGRNIFQNPEPIAALDRIVGLVHGFTKA